MKGTKPTKILVGGNRKAAQGFIGPANSQMEILKKQMSFQNRSQGVRRVWLHDDVYVECIKCFHYQECRIWVRPVVVPEEELLPKPESLYFYVRISRFDAYLPDYGYLDDTDRIIVWRDRGEAKADSLSGDDYVDYGTYESGGMWGITREGVVILDVDVAKEQVYSESGGVSVQTDLTQAEQLEKAKEYVEALDNGTTPEDLSGDFISGDISSPFELSSACSLRTDGGELYFNDAVSAYAIGSPETTYSFYHMNEKTPFEIYESEDCPSCTACSSPESVFEGNTWPKLEENRDKYLPTSNTTKGLYYEPEYAGIPCGISLGEGPHGNERYVGSLLYRVETGSPWWEGSCGFSDLNDELQHVAGVFYTTDNTYPCFFVTEVGATEQISANRRDYAVHGGWSSTDGTVQIDPWYCYCTIGMSDSQFYISTPLELLDLQEVIANTLMGNPCEETAGMFAWANGGSVGAEDSGQMVATDCGLGIIRSPAILGPRGEDAVNNGYVTISESEKDFNSSFCMASATGSDQETRNYAAISVFTERNMTAYGHLGGKCNGVNVDFDNFPSPDDYEYGYFVGMVFYIMRPTFFSKEDPDTGEIEYWDIHSEREETQSEINHNRLLDLEDYVNAILKDLKELPESRVLNNGELTRYRLLKESLNYNIETGFLFPLH